MSDLLERIEQSVRTRRLLRRGEKMLVAVSGGLDSMVLLRILHELSGRHGWRLTVAHLNHRLRGRSSDGDERLVIRTAGTLGLPVVTDRVDVRRIASAGGLSIEMAARKVRHEFLSRAARRLAVGTVALAHHADDQVELFFLRLLRGSGTEGLAGMKWRSRSPADSRVDLVRPLLDEGKSALRAYAAARRIVFREDASNASLDFQRNRIRHELLPALRLKHQPALDRVILRVMDLAGAESEFVRAVAQRWLKARDREAFGNLPLAVQRRCVQLQLLTRGIPWDYDLVERLRQRPGRSVAVAPQMAVALDASGVLRVIERAPELPAEQPLRIDLGAGAGECVFGGMRIRWRVELRNGGRVPKRRDGREVFDAASVGDRVILRHRRTGDRFQPIGMLSAVKLQDLLTNLKIPRQERSGLVLGETADGALFWVEKLRIAEQVKVKRGTSRRLHWWWERL